MEAPLRRVWENVFDWEHLPWLHRGSFSSIELEGSGSWGWCARVGLQPAGPDAWIRLGLFASRQRGRYVSVTLEGRGAGGETWTWLHEAGPTTTRVQVEFWLPVPDGEVGAALGRAMAVLYARLWDEDESMIVRRTRLVERVPDPGTAVHPAPLRLGPLAELRAGLPRIVSLGSQRFRLIEGRRGGEVLAHATLCPHLGGPLDAAELEDGLLRCPWHGYRFDAADGTCPEQPRLRLPLARMRVDDAGVAWLEPA